MSHLSTQVQIKTPADKLWKVLADLDSLSQWPADDVSPDPLENDENTVTAMYYNPDLLRNNIEDRTSVWQESHHYAYVVKNIGPIKFAYNRFALTPVGQVGEETLLTQTLDFQIKFGPAGALMDTLVFRPQFRKQMEQSLTALKGYVEHNVAGDSSVALDDPLAVHLIGVADELDLDLELVPGSQRQMVVADVPFPLELLEGPLALLDVSEAPTHVGWLLPVCAR
jgi:hypothetical protein